MGKDLVDFEEDQSDLEDITNPMQLTDDSEVEENPYQRVTDIGTIDHSSLP